MPLGARVLFRTILTLASLLGATSCGGSTDRTETPIGYTAYGEYSREPSYEAPRRLRPERPSVVASEPLELPGSLRHTEVREDTEEPAAFEGLDPVPDAGDTLE